MPLQFDANQLAAARDQEREINGMDDRDYIVTVCNVIAQALKSSTTRNLDLSEIRALVEEMQEKIEDKIYAQADKLEEPEVPEEDDLDLGDEGLGDDELDDLDLGESKKSSKKRFSLKEAKQILLKAGYNID
jgi:hypothetical protein